MANVFVELLEMLLKMVYYWIEGIVLFFVPASFLAKDISHDTVLITGAGSGIGRLMAIKFAEKGCRVVVWDVNNKGNEETASEIRKRGGKVMAYSVDLTDRHEIYKAANEVKKDVGQIDILVNNAGVVTGKKFLDCPDDLVIRTMDVNIMAHFWTAKCFLPGMIERNHGHLVNIASSAGFLGVTGLADYCASKYSAVGFDESMRFELNSQGKTGVHTTVVCPYFINTGMFDGVKTRFPFLLPILDPEYAVNKIMDAILCNQTVLLLPKNLTFFLALKGMLPTKCCQLLVDFFQISNSMDDFKGRGQKKEN
ncbi:protein dhs-3 isoform X2 [Patella vulgata]|uniref:protein dhs-3 isoform X1 n=1 Tax=Patella vulgata TaxID=6465 RepID=UPI002180995B|nr:protein dhs-3 isoform X1 [Patella vulgata]XP_055955376.1 protein dhs-3 isoform X1 [Patella vulgata]XP_055955378.1 protein dhs-3 isoform X2 [Patella vulgata]